MSAALMMAATPAERAAPESKASVCDISRDPVRYLGRHVVADAMLEDASPHAIYIRDPKSWGCILDIGNPAAGHERDVEDYLGGSFEVKVRIRGVLKSHMRNSSLPIVSEPELRYFVDELRVTPIKR